MKLQQIKKNNLYFYKKARMKPVFPRNLSSVFIALILSVFSLPAQGQQKNNFANNRIIVKFKPSSTPVCHTFENVVHFSISAVDDLNLKYNCVSARRINNGRKQKIQTYTYVLQFGKNIDISEAVKEYMATGYLQYAEPDYKGTSGGKTSTVPNDRYYYRQWSLQNDGTFADDTAKSGADIKMEEAWDIEKGDSSVIVAIIDEGARLSHPEFAGRIWKNYGEIPGNGIDDDGNGYIDDYTGWNFAYNNNNPTDDEGHGTNVAGIIGANANNTIGYAGIDWHCKLMIIKALDTNNFGYYSAWAEGITYATDNGAKVINMSLGGLTSSVTLQDAIDYAYANNVTAVVAMGNENHNSPDYPAACNHVIAVGATNARDQRADPFFWGGGSNYGTYISVVAPGNYIYGPYFLSDTVFYTYWGGTSQATPHVSALAALLLAQDSSRTPDEIKHIIEITADDTVGKPTEDTPGWDQYYGHGRINAYRALSYEKRTSVPAVGKPATVSLYPNPTRGEITVQAKGQLTPINYWIIDLKGCILSKGEISAQNSHINISSLVKGAYLVHLKGSDIDIIQKEILQ